MSSVRGYMTLTGGGAGGGTSEFWYRLTNGADGQTSQPGYTGYAYHWPTTSKVRLIKATLFSSNDPGSTTCEVYINVESPTASINGTFASASSLSSGYIQTAEFDAGDTVNAESLISLSIAPTNDPGFHTIAVLCRLEEE